MNIHKCWWYVFVLLVVFHIIWPQHEIILHIFQHTACFKSHACTGGPQPRDFRVNQNCSILVTVLVFFSPGATPVGHRGLLYFQQVDDHETFFNVLTFFKIHFQVIERQLKSWVDFYWLKIHTKRKRLDHAGFINGLGICTQKNSTIS